MAPILPLQQYDNNFMMAALTPFAPTVNNEDPESAEEGENDSADKNEGQSKKRKKAGTVMKGPKKKAKKAVAEGGDEVHNQQAKPNPKLKLTAAATKTSKKVQDKSSREDSDSSSESSEEETAERRASVKLIWALSQYRDPKKAMNGKARVWKFYCCYCTRYRCSARTDGIDEWAQETEKIKATSNFIKHAEDCEHRPSSQAWDQYQLVHERKRLNLPPLPMSSDPSPYEAEQEMMSDFIRCGVENPAKAVTNSSYRKHLVEAIVEDDLAFSVAEKGGMLRLLTHLVPRGVKTRVPHQTVQRDIDALHGALKLRLRELLKVPYFYFRVSGVSTTG
ncbi:hypothetical protein K438DRAFT_2127928 [Mycena galopus ATCC 62051]|nr:hypothetical protein K438DRAFT_2127928 [Mycena galopus ATCC 62051]